MVRPFRKPLIVVGPKKLLKLSSAVSNLEEMRPGRSFQPVLGDSQATKAERLVFLSGKLYYDLVIEREKRNLNDHVALIRLEELCPFPVEDLRQIVAQYPNAKGKRSEFKVKIASIKIYHFHLSYDFD
jgi:probable 2-oxoglutarate dehydrogenase E1 component DHKTD1